MKLIRVLALGSFLGAVAAVAVLGVSASAVEYGIKGVPELGHCAKVKRGTGEYKGAACLHRHPGHGGYNWRGGPAASKGKFVLGAGPLRLESHGKSAALITCEFANGQGEWISDKTLVLTKLVLSNCKNPAVSGEKTWCQSGETAGKIEGKELSGELGLISKSPRVVSKRVIGLDLAGNIAFECEGYIEALNKATGLGVKRELTGSAIGSISPTNNEGTRFAVPLEVTGAKQSPERFEGREKDTLTTLVGSEKTPEETTLTGNYEVKVDENLEIKAFCKGQGC
jgi:hypothetical protein